MKKNNLYWGITISAITIVFAWQLVSLASLYRFDKENFEDRINNTVHEAIFKLNALLSSKSSPGCYVGIDNSVSRVVYYRNGETDTIRLDRTMNLVDASNRAMYDIILSFWSLEKLDSLVQERTGKIPLYYRLVDSTGKVLQVHGGKDLLPGSVKGKSESLGFKAKHELNYNYTYPIGMFVSGEMHSIILLLFLFFAIVFSLVVLFYSLKQARAEARYREMVIGTIVHNLCTPIDNVTEALLLVREDAENSLEYPDKELLDGMLDELRGMSETTTRLLNLNSVMYGVKIKARDANLPGLFRQIIARYERHVYPSGKKVKFVAHLDMKNSIVQLDTNYFTEIAQNLIDNSIKYSGEEASISISCEEQGDNVIVRFEDNGRGMSKEFVKRAFKPYTRYTGKNYGNPDGYGLGLFFVWQAVKAHGGSIKLNSREDEGTEFIITFPRESKYYAED